MSGYAPDVKIQAEELLRMQRKVHEILAVHTEKTPEQIAQDFDRDYYMDAQTAVDYGMVDEILQPASKKPAEEEANGQG